MAVRKIAPLEKRTTGKSHHRLIMAVRKIAPPEKCTTGKAHCLELDLFILELHERLQQRHAVAMACASPPPRPAEAQVPPSSPNPGEPTTVPPAKIPPPPSVVLPITKPAIPKIPTFSKAASKPGTWRARLAELELQMRKQVHGR